MMNRMILLLEIAYLLANELGGWWKLLMRLILYVLSGILHGVSIENHNFRWTSMNSTAEYATEALISATSTISMAKLATLF